MNTVEQKPEDWVDEYFSIQKDFGLDVGFKFGCSNKESSTKWSALSHERFDGIGGFAHTLRKKGWPVKTLPQSRDLKPPSRLSMVLPMIRYTLEKKKVVDVRWNEECEENKTKNTELSSKGFTLEETKRIILKAKNENVTVNTLLLESINKIVAKFLQNKNNENIWIIPVNIRGAITRKDDTSNHVSFFPVVIKDRQSLLDIQKESKKNLENKSQWVTWHFLNLIGKKKGRKGIEDIVKSTINKKIGVTGVFSNLGSWPHKNDFYLMSEYSEKISDNNTWFFSPNITLAVPVGAGAITWFGKLGLTVQVHPYITTDKTVAQKILKEWQEDLLF